MTSGLGERLVLHLLVLVVVLVVVVDSWALPRWGFDDEDDDPSAPLRAGYDDDCGTSRLP